jgi:trimethylamine--corrinoid protein Co-methyltransferase
VVQGLAECLCGLVIHQLTAEGAPFLLGMGPAVLDMATVECSYNAPEYYLSYITFIEMTHHYDLPSWGYAGHSDASMPDGQAVLEAGTISLLAALAGANLCHDVGYLDFGRMGSLEMLVIADEVLGGVERFARGAAITDETTAVDVIRDAAPKGHFLGHQHTRKNVRSTHWRPRLLNRLGFEAWQGAGGRSLTERATERVQEILDQHRPEPLPAELGEAMRRRVEEY